MPSFISFIPTPYDDIEGFFELVTLSSSDIVYDLGSGDGRLLFGALEKGAGKVVGIDIDPQRVHEAREIARSKGLDDRASFIEADVMDVSLADASVVLCYLSHSASAALKPKFESELKPGTRVVMESFPIPGWKPVKTFDREYKHFYLYTMPPELSDEYTTSYADYDLYYY
jgi:ubiquinone/menaquinone biosynthesis C-methylase UbiE